MHKQRIVGGSEADGFCDERKHVCPPPDDMFIRELLTFLLAACSQEDRSQRSIVVVVVVVVSQSAFMIAPGGGKPKATYHGQLRQIFEQNGCGRRRYHCLAAECRRYDNNLV